MGGWFDFPFLRRKDDLTVQMTTQTTSIRLRTPFIGLLAGLIAGALNAAVACLLMRVVALATVGRGAFSVGGTAVIFGFALILGPLLGLAYRAALPKLPGRALARGLLFGLALLVVFQMPILFIVPEFRTELMVAGTVGFGVFGLINFAFVLLLVPITGWLEQTWPRDASRRAVVLAGTAVMGLLALGGLGVLIYQLGGRLLGLVG